MFFVAFGCAQWFLVVWGVLMVLVVFDGLWWALVALDGPCNGCGNGLKMAEKSGRQTSKTVAHHGQKLKFTMSVQFFVFFLV